VPRGNRGRILAAFDEKKNFAAAIFCVWDHAVSYYMMTTRTVTSDSGIISALVWLAITDAARRELTFDFGGLIAAKAVPFYASFGGDPSPRYVATRAAPPVLLARDLRAFNNKDRNIYSEVRTSGGALQPKRGPDGIESHLQRFAEADRNRWLSRASGCRSAHQKDANERRLLRNLPAALARQLARSHQHLIDRAGGLAAFPDRPHDERLAPAHVAARKDFWHRGQVVFLARLHIAARIKRHAEIFQ